MSLPREGRLVRLSIARMIWLTLRQSRSQGAIPSVRETAAKWQYKAELLQMVWAAHREDPFYPLRWLYTRQLYRRHGRAVDLRRAFLNSGGVIMFSKLIDVDD